MTEFVLIIILKNLKISPDYVLISFFFFFQKYFGGFSCLILSKKNQWSLACAFQMERLLNVPVINMHDPKTQP